MTCTKIIKRIINTLSQSNTFGFGTRGVKTAKTVEADPDWLPIDTPTHTNQQWSKNDYRLSRFIDKRKLVNEKFPLNYILKLRPIPCKKRIICCDGGDSYVGHPRIFINLDKPGVSYCLYCGQPYILERKD